MKKINNINKTQSPFSKEHVNNALSWTNKLVVEAGARLSGTEGCFKAAQEIYSRFHPFRIRIIRIEEI